MCRCESSLHDPKRENEVASDARWLSGFPVFAIVGALRALPGVFLCTGLSSWLSCCTVVVVLSIRLRQ